MELVRLSLINRLERVASSPVYWLHVDIRLLINEAENFYLCSALFVEGGRQRRAPPHLTENCVYTARRRAQTSLRSTFIAPAVLLERAKCKRDTATALWVYEMSSVASCYPDEENEIMTVAAQRKRP